MFLIQLDDDYYMGRDDAPTERSKARRFKKYDYACRVKMDMVGQFPQAAVHPVRTDNKIYKIKITRKAFYYSTEYEFIEASSENEALDILRKRIPNSRNALLEVVKS